MKLEGMSYIQDPNGRKKEDKNTDIPVAKAIPNKYPFASMKSILASNWLHLLKSDRLW